MQKDTFFISKQTLNCRGKIINLSSPLVMGILNITPDSFFDGGRYNKPLEIIKQADKLLSEGAEILDLGAASTRPGSLLVDPLKEQERLLPAINLILKQFPSAILSIDTYHASTARAAIAEGAHIINDISAGALDPLMFPTIAELQVPYIIMHMQGTPADMQQNPVYEEVTRDILFFFAQKVEQLRKLGVHDIIIDPGFGFGKTLEDNYRLLHNLAYFKIFELPILAGVSRKSMINKILNTQPQEALNGTAVLNTIALQKGASILRVHDAREAVQAIKIVEMLTQTVSRS